MAHDKPTHRDRNAIDAPQHPVKPLPDGHPQRVVRPRGAGSEIRKGLRGYDEAGQFVPPKGFGITDENAERVLRSIYSDEDDAGRGPRNVGKALIIVAVLTAGALVLVVGLAYGWGMFW